MGLNSFEGDARGPKWANENSIETRKWFLGE
jgi:hypothetical protein